MSAYRRFAVYYLPDDPALARFGAAWLGWDVERGAPADHLAVGDGLDLEAVTASPRKYGFHATLKAPFRLAEGMSEAGLAEAVAALAGAAASVRVAGLRPDVLGGFLALLPQGDVTALSDMAFRCVSVLDAFRAPLSDQELARRRAPGLSETQDALLLRWGYPYVAEAFRFHMTLTGALDSETLERARAAVEAALPPLAEPFEFRSISLVGERHDGCFELIHRYALTG